MANVGGLLDAGLMGRGGRGYCFKRSAVDSRLLLKIIREMPQRYEGMSAQEAPETYLRIRISPLPDPLSSRTISYEGLYQLIAELIVKTHLGEPRCEKKTGGIFGRGCWTSDQEKEFVFARWTSRSWE